MGNVSVNQCHLGFRFHQGRELDRTATIIWSCALIPDRAPLSRAVRAAYFATLTVPVDDYPETDKMAPDLSVAEEQVLVLIWLC